MACRPEDSFDIGGAFARIRAFDARCAAQAAHYARAPADWAATRAPLLWITGLAGSGKTTLARALHARLQGDSKDALLLDGDAVRIALGEAVSTTPGEAYAPAQRRARAWRLLRLAHAATAEGLACIVATVSLQAEVLSALRASQSRLGVLVLQASPALLRARRPDLYADPQQAAQVVGLGQPADWPRAPARVLSASLPTDSQLRLALQQWDALACRPTEPACESVSA